MIHKTLNNYLSTMSGLTVKTFEDFCFSFSSIASYCRFCTKILEGQKELDYSLFNEINLTLLGGYAALQRKGIDVEEIGKKIHELRDWIFTLEDRRIFSLDEEGCQKLRELLAEVSEIARKRGVA